MTTDRYALSGKQLQRVSTALQWASVEHCSVRLLHRTTSDRQLRTGTCNIALRMKTECGKMEWYLEVGPRGGTVQDTGWRVL